MYYEICFQNPTPGETSIPIAAMISEKHDEPQISDFLSHPHHAEKIDFGHGNIRQPLQINIDFSMALLVSVLKVFNTESVDDYLDRSWRIFQGTASSKDLEKTPVHICLAHIMNNMKRRLKDVSRKNLDFLLYVIGLLIQFKTLEEMRELLFDCFVIFNSECISPVSEPHLKRLLAKINSFDSSYDHAKNDRQEHF